MNGFLDARDIFEGRLVPFFGQQPRLALAETQRALACHFNLANEEEPDQRRNDDNGQDAQHETEQHGVRLARLELRQVDQFLFQLRIQHHFGLERRLDLPLVVLPVFAGYLSEVRALRVVIDGGRNDLIGLHQLHELGLFDDIARRLHLILEQHEQSDATKNCNNSNKKIRQYRFLFTKS